VIDFDDNLNDWDDNFPLSDDFNGRNNGDFSGSIGVEEKDDDGINNDEDFPPTI
jgi:hypothetical protein